MPSLAGRIEHIRLGMVHIGSELHLGSMFSRDGRYDRPPGVACMKRLITVDETKEVCRVRSVWRSVHYDRYPVTPVTPLGIKREASSSSSNSTQV